MKISSILRPAVLLNAALSTTVFASDRLDAISVIATKHERSIFETPESVSKINQEQLDSQQAQKLSDVLKNIPGVSFSGGPRAVAEKPSIRGLSDNRILITVDGARQNFNSAHKGRIFIDPELLKSVDVMRGPGSAMYGSGAMGGVIAMQTKDAADFLEPNETIGLRIKSGFQSVNDDKQLSGILFGRVEQLANMAYLLSANYKDSQDIALGNGSDLDNSAEELLSNLAKLSWTFSKTQQLHLSHQYNFQRGEIPAQADRAVSATSVLTDRETEVILDRIAYTLKDTDNHWLNLESFIYYNQQTIREKRIGTSGRLDIIDFDTPGLDIRNSSFFSVNKNHHHRLSYGLEYYQDKMQSREGNNIDQSFPNASSHVYGIYLQDEITVKDSFLGSWLIIPGVRYDHAKSQSKQADVIGVNKKNNAEKISPKLGLVYTLTPNINLTMNYSQAFRIPSFQELYISGLHFGANNFEPNPDLKPEKLEHGIELGIRYRAKDRFFKGDKAGFQLNTYYNRYKDFIGTKITTTTTRSENISEASTEGIEIESSYYHPSWDIETTLSGTYIKGDDLTEKQPIGDIPGNNITIAMEKFLPDWGISMGWQAAFHAQQDRVPTGQPTTQAYQLYDIHLNWSPYQEWFSDMQVNVGIDNLTDEYYTPHLSLVPAAGRNIKMSVTIQL